ncbi:hypothetical protein OHA21_11050 [Actinoplanes sp. NBC_00393]|uniref:hypothetical protein n=1 Tax=Actinoplanes sp. NBC_00393 TaxID=2975953 RepID=UPI002E1C3851
MASRYERTVLVAAGWYAAAAVPFFINSRLAHEDRSCDDTGNLCFTAQDRTALLFAGSLLFLGASLLAAALVALPLSRRPISVFAAGTVSALAGSMTAGAGLLLWIAAA